MSSVSYGLWLNEKGKVLADSYILKEAADSFLVVSGGVEPAMLQARLEANLIADEVTIEDRSARWLQIGIWSDKSDLPIQRLVGQTLAPGAWVEGKGVRAFSGRLSAQPNLVLLAPAVELHRITAVLAECGAREVDQITATRERILSALPAVPADIGPQDLPNEGGLEDVAISYTKGCYLGQEVMARLKNLGQVRRRLHVVRGEGPTPAAGTALFQGERKVGELRSSAPDGTGFVAMAMLSLLQLNTTAPLGLTPNGPAQIEILRRV